MIQHALSLLQNKYFDCFNSFADLYTLAYVCLCFLVSTNEELKLEPEVMASDDNNMLVEGNGANVATNVDVAANNVNATQGRVFSGVLPNENERIASSGNASFAHIPQLLTPVQALAVMMDSRRAV